MKAIGLGMNILGAFFAVVGIVVLQVGDPQDSVAYSAMAVALWGYQRTLS